MRAGSCGHCGAPLPLPTGGVVICGYCGRQYQVATPPPQPQRFPQPAAAPLPGSGSASASKTIAIVVGAILLTVLLGVATSVTLFVRAAASPTSMPGGARPAPPGAPGTASNEQHRWLSRHAPALTRGSGSSANVVGMVDFGTADLSLIDGASGKFMWHVPAPIDSEVYTDGVDRILAYDNAKRVIRYDLQTGKVRWTITVADFVHDISFGSGCASLRFGKPLGIDTETGSLKDCSPTRPALLRVEWDQPRDVSMKRGDMDLLGAIQLDNKPVNGDPPRFSVKASRGGHELWRAVPTTLEPIWTSDGFVRSLALTPAVYTSSSDIKVEGDVWLAAAGPHVFVSHDVRLETYVAATGKLAWKLSD
jgi:hypothetical protein